MQKIDLKDYDGIIFDLDGVIYDITEAIKKAVDDAVEKYELEVKKDEVMQEIAHLIEEIQNYPVPKIILNSYELLTPVEFLKGVSYFKKMRIAIFLFNQFNKYKEETASVYGGMKEFVHKLKENGKKLAILTNNKSAYAEEVLEEFQLDDVFSPIIGFNEVSEVKPSPEGINKIIESWNVDRSEVIFIGDMTTDVKAGKAANVKVISVVSGLASKESLAQEEPDYLVENPEELISSFQF